MDIDQIKARNTASGRYFFSPDTLRFFRSRVSNRTHCRADGRVYFVTSESGPFGRGTRAYTVRYTDDGGASIETEGAFQAFSSSRAAHGRAAYLASGR
jgi:hypothetical protein